MILLFIAQEYYPCGGAADYVVGLPELTSAHYVPAIREFVYDAEAEAHNWTSCALFISALDTVTMQRWGSTLDFDDRPGTFSMYRNVSRTRLKLEEYENAVVNMCEDVDLLHLPGAEEVDWTHELKFGSDLETGEED